MTIIPVGKVVRYYLESCTATQKKFRDKVLDLEFGHDDWQAKQVKAWQLMQEMIDYESGSRNL